MWVKPKYAKKCKNVLKMLFGGKTNLEIGLNEIQVLPSNRKVQNGVICDVSSILKLVIGNN